MVVSSWGKILAGIVFRSNFQFGELQQWWLACVPKHPVMKRIVESIVHEVHERAEKHMFMKKTNLGTNQGSCSLDVLRLTGPLRFTEEVVRHVDSGTSDVRVVCGNANNIMVYDVSGNHVSGSGYQTPVAC